MGAVPTGAFKPRTIEHMDPTVQSRAVEVPKKAPIHSKCSIRGFRETGLALAWK